MFTRASLLLGGAALFVAGCGSFEHPSTSNTVGKGDSTSPIEIAGEVIGDWKVYAVDRWVEVGGDGSREALIRLRVPKAEGQPVVAPPVVRLRVMLPPGERINDSSYRAMLYHDYYLRGPKAGTHKYMVPLAVSQARVSHSIASVVTFEWRLAEVVGDPNNATTWALSFASFAPEVAERAIVGAEIWFKQAAGRDEGLRYETDFWPGEWPAGYEVLRDVTVAGRVEPVLEATSSPCTLGAGSRFHPWDETPVVYRTTIERFHAQRDLAMQQCYYNEQTNQTDCNSHPISAGDIVEQLTYLGEGFCLLRHGGVEFDEECLGTGRFDEFVAIPGSELPDERYFKAACAEGGEAWIADGELTDAMFADGIVQTYVPYDS